MSFASVGEGAVRGRALLCPWFKGGRVVERRLSWWGQHLGWDSMLALLLEHPLGWELALIKKITILTSGREDIVEVVQDPVICQHVLL